MGYSVFPAPIAGGKTSVKTSLTSGTSWTVPAGVTYVNATLYGGGGGGGQGTNNSGTGSGGSGGTTTFGALSASGGSGGNYMGINLGSTGYNRNGVPQAANTGLGGEPGYSSLPGSGFDYPAYGSWGSDGAVRSGTVSTTPGGTVAYSIGSGGAGGSGLGGGYGGAGGSGRIDLEYWV